MRGVMLPSERGPSLWSLGAGAIFPCLGWIAAGIERRPPAAASARAWRGAWQLRGVQRAGLGSGCRGSALGVPGRSNKMMRDTEIERNTGSRCGPTCHRLCVLPRKSRLASATAPMLQRGAAKLRTHTAGKKQGAPHVPALARRSSWATPSTRSLTDALVEPTTAPPHRSARRCIVASSMSSGGKRAQHDAAAFSSDR